MSDATNSADIPSDAVLGDASACRYELIIVASREARRLNEYYRQRAIQPKRRVTSEAIDRVFQGPGVAYEFVSSRELAAADAASIATEGGRPVETPADTEA